MTPRASTTVVAPTGPVTQLIEAAALLTDTPDEAACALIAAAAWILRSTGIEADAAVLLAEVLRDEADLQKKGGAL